MIIFFATSLQAAAQQYRLVCSDAALPELYTKIEVYAEELQGSTYKKLPARSYTLTAAGAEVDGNIVHINRPLLYKQDGKLQFSLHRNGHTIPLMLALPVLADVRYNLYTDSIKPVLNYYVNVEGIFSNGKIYPLDTTLVKVTASEGSMKGLEWILPTERSFDSVTFTTTCLYNTAISKSTTLYLKKYKDPRDAADYEEPLRQKQR